MTEGGDLGHEAALDPQQIDRQRPIAVVADYSGMGVHVAPGLRRLPAPTRSSRLRPRSLRPTPTPNDTFQDVTLRGVSAPVKVGTIAWM